MHGLFQTLITVTAKIWIVICICQFFHTWKFEIMTFRSNSYQRFPKEIRLRLTNRMISLIINDKNLNWQLICLDCLKFLKVHLYTSISCQTYKLFCSICNTGSNCCRKIISHRSNCRINNKTLSFFDGICMTANNTCRSISYNRNIVFRQRIT